MYIAHKNSLSTYFYLLARVYHIINSCCQVKVDTHLHGTNNAQVTDFEIKRYQNSHEVKKDIPPSNAMSSVNGDNKRNVKAAVSSQQKTEHKLLDVQLPKEKIKNDASSLQIKPRDLDPVKLPEINLSPGNNHSLSKVKCYVSWKKLLIHISVLFPLNILAICYF